MQQCSLKLKTYSGESLIVKGLVKLNVKHSNKECRLPLIIVESSCKNMPLLMGRPWINVLGISLNQICSIQTKDRNSNTADELTEKLCNKFHDVFQ